MVLQAADRSKNEKLLICNFLASSIFDDDVADIILAIILGTIYTCHYFTFGGAVV